MPRWIGLQVYQRGEPPELRGQAAAQAVALKPPARGAPERDHGGTKTPVRFPYAPPHSVPSHPSCHGLEAGGVPRGAAAHSALRLVSRPSCEGTLPLRSFWLRDLREGRRSGIMGERRRMQRAASATRALPLRDRRHPPCPPTPYAATAWRRGCRGVAAHRYVSAVSSPGCEGKPPLRTLL